MWPIYIRNTTNKYTVNAKEKKTMTKENTNENGEGLVEKKKRGRPTGSKNAPKEEIQTSETPDVTPKKRGRPAKAKVEEPVIDEPLKEEQAKAPKSSKAKKELDAPKIDKKQIRPEKGQFKKVDPKAEYDYATDLEDDTYIIGDKAALVVTGLSSMSSAVFESVVKINSKKELRFLVDNFYQYQDIRKATDNQIRSILQGVDGEGNEPPITLKWLGANISNTEKQLSKALNHWVLNSDTPVAKWCMANVGIGHILTAGLLAYFDVTGRTSSNTFIQYAGLNDNNVEWLKEAQVKTALQEFDEYRDDKYSVYDVPSKQLVNIIKKAFKAGLVCEVTDLLYAVIDDHDDTCKGYTKNAEVANEIRTLAKATENISDLTESLMYFCVPDYIALVDCAKIGELTGRNPRQIYDNIKDRELGYRSKERAAAFLKMPPYNRSLKTLCWKVGCSFQKQCNNEKSLYGRLYQERKAQETLNNENGLYAKEATRYLQKKNFGKDMKELYESGKLSAGHIDARARRFAIKVFITHLFEAMYIAENKTKPPVIYAIAHLDHVDYIEPEVPFSIMGIDYK